MRTIKELLQLMLDNQKLFKKGLCSWSRYLHYEDIITGEECDLLKSFIKKNKPKGFKGLYYWEAGDIAPRIKWLKEHINK